jgi:hypothetical protein
MTCQTEPEVTISCTKRPAEDVKMLHLDNICSLGHTPQYSGTSIKAFSPQQYTNFLLTISDFIKSNFLCPQIEEDSQPRERSLDMPKCYK